MLSPQSDFERERQRILAEIESRARRNGGELTLQDWLKAAEEVMPDAGASAARAASDEEDDVVLNLRHAGRAGSSTTNTASTQQSRRNTEASPRISPSNNTPPTGDDSSMDAANVSDRRTVIYTSLIGITLVVLTLSIGGLAWLDLKKELKAVTTVNTELKRQLAELKLRVDTLEKQQVTGGDSARFDALVARVAKLEQGGSFPHSANAAPSNDQVREQVQAELNNANVITEAVLDAKLAQLSQRIEQVIDKRFTAILTQIKSLRALEVKQQMGETEATLPVSAKHAKQPETPTIPEPDAPKAPEIKPAKAAAGDLTASEQWLRAQPDNAWLLQLASVLDKNSLIKLRQRKQLPDARIVRQQRSGRTFYVLVQGIYPDRETAKSVADEIRQRTGINPWIRRVRALLKGLPTQQK